MRPVPEETARVAHAAFPTGNMYLRLQEELGSIYEDEGFTKLLFDRMHYGVDNNVAALSVLLLGSVIGLAVMVVLTKRLTRMAIHGRRTRV